MHLLVSSKSATFPSQKSPSLTRVKKRCQHIPPSFGTIYFVPKLLQPAFKAIHRTPCIWPTPYDRVKTLLCPWPFTFRPQKPNAPIHLSSFHLPRLGHKHHLPSLYRQQVSISYRASFLLSPAKTLGLQQWRAPSAPMRVLPMPHRRSVAAWSKPFFLPSSDYHAFVQL